MKHLLVIGALVGLTSLVQAEPGARNQFNQNPNQQDARAQVEAIAAEQGIDLSTHEGRRMMAQHLQDTGQESLLPPRRHRRGGQQGQQFNGGQQGPSGGENCNKQNPQGSRQRPGGPRPNESI